MQFNSEQHNLPKLDVAEDSTESKQAEESLRESEARLKLALEAANMGIWDWNLSTGERLWSPNMGPLYGLPSGTLCPSFEDLVSSIHPEDRDAFTQAVNNSIQHKVEFAIEYRAIWPDGSLHWLGSRGQVYYNNSGQPLRMIGTTRDISDRKQAEQQIAEQASLLDIATDAIFVRDFEHQILYWNHGAQRMFGWEKHEVLGQNANQLFYGSPSPSILQMPLKTVIKSGSWQGELRKRTKSGQEIIVESRWTLMLDSDGQPKSILIVDTDITQKKQLQEQFFRIQRLESIGTLAGGIAHDINNILTPILGAAQVLKGRLAQDPERYQQMLNMIENNAKRGSALVKQVLSFARGFKGERTIIQVRHLITEILQVAKQTFPRIIEFRAHIPEDLWPVSGDSTQLHQVLMNLVVNARDAMPQGGTLTISAVNQHLDEVYTRMNLEATVGNYIVITVADTGMGMEPEVLERIFEPFFTTKDVGTGTGLGLSTVRGIVKSHGGFVRVSSQVGQGTEFNIFLPAVEDLPAPEPDALEIPQGRGELILVVDDEANILDVAKIILESHNYQTVIASNGVEAIAIYAKYKEKISAVLMNMLMPEMDGTTAIRTIHKINPQIPIISCSGLNTTGNVLPSISLNVQAVLAKPFTGKELLHSLNRVLSR
jgi:PAS domain S-box-containing protein